MLERRDGAVDRGLADGTGRGNALAEPDDPRERIDHAKAVAGRTGDQKPAIVGAEVERGVDTVSACPPQPTLTGLRGPEGHREAAYPHSSKLSFRGRIRAAEELPFTETLAAPRGYATTHHIGLCPIRRCRAVMQCVI